MLDRIRLYKVKGSDKIIGVRLTEDKDGTYKESDVVTGDVVVLERNYEYEGSKGISYRVIDKAVADNATDLSK